MTEGDLSGRLQDLVCENDHHFLGAVHGDEPGGVLPSPVLLAACIAFSRGGLLLG